MNVEHAHDRDGHRVAQSPQRRDREHREEVEHAEAEHRRDGFSAKTARLTSATAPRLNRTGRTRTTKAYADLRTSESAARRDAPGVPSTLVQAEGVKRILVGRPMASGQMEDTLLSKFLALPVFASDPLSSVAYATEAAMVVLVARIGRRAAPRPADLVRDRGDARSSSRSRTCRRCARTRRAAARTSWRRTTSARCRASSPRRRCSSTTSSRSPCRSPRGSSRSRRPRPRCTRTACGSRSRASSLLTVANLRGVRESGLLFALPTYGFVLSLYAVLATGVAKCAVGTCPQAHVPHPVAAGTGAVTLLVVLRAFASGSAALTGVESISNGVSAFKRPQSKNAAQTLGDHGRDRDLALHRRVVARGADARAAERDGVGAVADRARVVPDRADVLRRPGLHARDPDPRRELLVPGLPAARSAARARPLLPAAVREPRRPARLLERDRPRRRARLAR